MLYLELARRDKNLTQHQLGQETHIGPSFISLCESGRGIPNDDQLARLARALDVTPDLLLKVVPSADAISEQKGTVPRR